MAIDQCLLDRADRMGERWLRLYRWEPHCLSFGRHEPALRRYDRDRIAALGLDVVRRPTGGRAVWHARELTYAVAAPSDELGGLREAYLEIHRMLVEALARLDVPAHLAPAGPPGSLDAGACFSRPAGGELLVEGRKMVGSAQLRQGTALLQHGSILLEDDQQVVSDVSLGTAPRVAPGRLATPSGRTLGQDDVARAIAWAAPRRWPGRWCRVADADAVVEAGERRHGTRFRSEAWTWRA